LISGSFNFYVYESMLRPPFKPLAPPLGVAPHSLRTTAVQ
jgi:hypothetical protein